MEAVSAERTLDGPRRSARVLLLAAVAATTYLDYFAYKQQGYGAPDVLDARLLGHAPAPEQYRMGVFVAAHWLAAHLHVVPAMALTLIDGISAVIAVLLLFNMLERTTTYARAGRTLQWFGATVLVLLLVWWLGWLFWLQKPETLPATALVSVMLWLWGNRVPLPAQVLALLAATLALATFRADIACLLNAGVLLYVLAGRGPQLPLRRSAAALAAAVGATASVGIQLWLARIVYPQAGYGRVKLWQLMPNLIHATRWPPFVLFLLPLLWMAQNGAQHASQRGSQWGARRGLPRDAAGRAVLVGAVLYLALWCTIGKIDEVRIFLPFAFALAPLTSAAAMERVQPPGITG